MTDLPLDGTVLAGFEPVRETFTELLRSETGTGASLNPGDGRSRGLGMGGVGGSFGWWSEVAVTHSRT